MARSLLRLGVPLVAAVAGWAIAMPAGAATGVQVTDAQLLPGGGAVLVTASIACDPLPAGSLAFYGVDLWQGTFPHRNYIEGFGSYGAIGQSSLECDGTAHSHTVTVSPSQDYADRRFRPGPAMTDSVITVCAPTAPDAYQCDVLSDQRQPVRIHR
jgi:hypothetical protein